MFYATVDNDGDRINDSADIVAFETEAQAREWLVDFYDRADWKRETAVIEPGRFGDCWIKTYSEPKTEKGKLIVGAFDCEPFGVEQLYIASPGQHPGGRVWWISPRVEVLAVTSIQPNED